MVLIVSSMLVTPVLVRGPAGAGGETGFCAPFNWNAFWHSGQYFGTSILGVGTQTTIWEDDVTIVMSAIPEATVDENWEYIAGTVLMYKASHAWLENPYQQNAWVSYKFWLNSYGPVPITYAYDGGPTVTENITEFVFIRVQYVGEGVGNSDYDAGRNFDITIQAYK